MGQITPEGHHVGQVSEAQLFAALFPGARCGEDRERGRARLASSTAELWDVHNEAFSRHLRGAGAVGAPAALRGPCGGGVHLEHPRKRPAPGTPWESSSPFSSSSDKTATSSPRCSPSCLACPRRCSTPRRRWPRGFRKEASSVGRPDPDHPLIQSFHGLVASLEKLASAREELEELTGAQARVRAQLKVASGGLVGKGWHALKSTADWAGKGRRGRRACALRRGRESGSDTRPEL
jgi:hypothetical protein